MSLLSYIHRERNISLKHWRYRLLHWTFEQEDVTWDADHGVVAGTELPTFYYKHYCPLFHITNLIMVFLPVIVLWKSVKAVFRWLNSCVQGWANRRVAVKCVMREATPAEMLKELTTQFRNAVAHYLYRDEQRGTFTTREDEFEYVVTRYNPGEHPSKKYAVVGSSIPKESLLEIYTTTLEDCPAHCIDNYCHYYNADNFEAFWDEQQKAFALVLSKEEAKALFDAKKEKDRIRAARDKAIADRRYQFFVFWSNIGRVICKALGVAFYGTVALAVGYVGIYWVLPISWWLLTWAWSVDWEYVATNVFKVASVLFTCGLAVYLCWRFKAVATPVKGCASVVLGVIPWVILKDAWDASALWFFTQCSNACEFLSLLYADNCPPIKIVDEKEEPKGDS